MIFIRFKNGFTGKQTKQYKNQAHTKSLSSVALLTSEIILRDRSNVDNNDEMETWTGLLIEIAGMTSRSSEAEVIQL